MNRYLLVASLTAWCLALGCTPPKPEATSVQTPPTPAPEPLRAEARSWSRDDERPCRLAEAPKDDGPTEGASTNHEAKSPSLMIMAPGPPFEVTLDGAKLLCNDAEAEPVFVAPGSHELRLTGPKTEPIEHTVEAQPEDDNRLIQFP